MSVLDDLLRQHNSSFTAGTGELGDRLTTALIKQQDLTAEPGNEWGVTPVDGGGEPEWFLLASDNENERRGVEVVNAFFGPGLVRVLHGTDRGEADGASHVRRRQLELVGSKGDFVRAFELMTSVRGRTPDLRRDVELPLSLLLRDFYLALDQRDPNASSDLLARVDATGQVGAENLRFLRVERLARLGHWAEVAELPWFETLARARRPRRITEHLLEALWRQEFDEAAIASDPNVAWEHFEEAEIGSRFGSLINAVDVPATAAGRRMTTVACHLHGDAERLQRIRDGAEEAERSFLDLLIGRGVQQAADTKAPPRSLIEQAREDFDLGRFVEVVELAESDPDVLLAELAVRAAFELSDSSLAIRAVAVVESVGREGLPTTPGFTRVLEVTEQLASNACPDWRTWFDRVAADERWSDAAEVARDHSDKWSGDGLQSAIAASHAAEALLQASDGVNAREVRAVLDLLCGLGRELTRVVAAEPFVDAVLLLLGSDENPSDLVRAAFQDLLTESLAAGPSIQRYADLLEAIEALWLRVRSREAVDWILDLLETLAASGSPDEGSRRALVNGVGNSMRDIWSRVPSHQQQLLLDLASECDAAVDLVVSDELDVESDPWGMLNGRLVGLYSLLEGVGARLGERLRLLAPEVRVEHNTDLVSTPRLLALAGSADYLIVDTRHAAHQATGAIDSVRPRSAQLFPAGRGMSSFLSRLREALADESGDGSS